MNQLLPISIELPKDFLEEEKRCDYTISHEMKEIWAVELDLLYVFQCACEKYNLKFFADGGTLLGAVRHNGFIPWDDDIDIIMFRDDYEKLCSVAQDVFKYPYFWQTEFTDPSSLRGHAQLRNSETTAVLSHELEGKHTINQGIFIDIFPIDSAPDEESKMEKKIQKTAHYLKTARKLANFTDIYTLSPNPVRRLIKKVMTGLFSGILRKYFHYDKYYNLYEAECKSYNEEDTVKVAKYFCVPFNRGQIWYREDFANTEKRDFEFLKIPIPNGYERILTTFFGPDWKTPKRVSTVHSGVLFDPHTPYKEYLEGYK